MEKIKKPIGTSKSNSLKAVFTRLKAIITDKYLKPETIYQISRFIITGILAAGVDYGVYIALFGHAGIVYAKAISFVTATVFTYIVNKFWTFERKHFSAGEAARFIGLYILSMILNTAINKAAFLLSGSKPIGFIFATGFCAVFNFLGLKLFVFGKHKG